MTTEAKCEDCGKTTNALYYALKCAGIECEEKKRCKECSTKEKMRVINRLSEVAMNGMIKS